MRNALSIDLEEYFQVSAYADRVSFDDWDAYPSRVAENTDRILALLEEHHCKATFFVLGWVAQKHPKIVARVAGYGHEIACHSLLHRRVFDLTSREFREDTRKAKSIIEDASGMPVLGYRAPSFSITSNSTWAFEILVEEGFRYDSSIFPIEHPSYGIAGAPRAVFKVETPSGPILEFPMPTLCFGSLRSPIGGGAYLRLLPYLYTLWAIRYINRSEKNPICVYFHPWELDPDQPRMNGDVTARMRHYFGMRTMETKLRRLLSDFRFGPLGSLIAGLDLAAVETGRLPLLEP
jgi:polysaccharide deacetylase family protein (PEP-CTERM system associated)